jgi:hypothetical protein
MINWTQIFDIIALIGCSFILLPFLGYLISKCVVLGMLTAKRQFKEYENGEN